MIFVLLLHFEMDKVFWITKERQRLHSLLINNVSYHYSFFFIYYFNLWSAYLYRSFFCPNFKGLNFTSLRFNRIICPKLNHVFNHHFYKINFRLIPDIKVSVRN